MKKVIKRSGNIVNFDREKIKIAIGKAMMASINVIDNKCIDKIAEDIEFMDKEVYEIAEIEKMVFDKLCQSGFLSTARAYESYRSVRDFQRTRGTVDNQILGLINGDNVKTLNENSNKNKTTISTIRDLTAEEVSKDIALRLQLPLNISQAHLDGLIYIHDLGHWINKSFNCCLINLKNMLENGTVINEKMIETPKSFQTACTIATQIIAQVASGQHGGQTISLSHLSPFVRKQKQKILLDVIDSLYSIDVIEHNSLDELTDDEKKKCMKITNKRLKKEINAGIQTFMYQINTLQTSNGQSPFLTIAMGIEDDPEYKEETVMLIEEVLRQRIQGMKNKKGQWIAPAFPKLVYLLDENNIHEDSKYYYLTELAAECVSKRMMPDMLSAKILRENYEGNIVYPMGCRSFLSPWKNEKGEYQWYGRSNCGVVSLNLPDIALSSKGDMDKFWEIFDDRLELCREACMLRYNRLLEVTAESSPIHYMYGAICRLKPDDTLDKILKDGRTTISLGYIGVYEAVLYMIGESNTTEKGEKLALEIVQHMRDAVDKWKKETGIGFGLYGTPAEGLTEKFAESCRRRFGVIKGITDKDYLTNSFHVNVTEPINAFDKLKYEGKFHKISSGGCISYVELPNLQHNIEAIIKLMQYGYDCCQYFEFNTKLDICHRCGYDGEMLLDDNNEWYCPNCDNRDTRDMTIVRRTCG